VRAQKRNYTYLIWIKYCKMVGSSIITWCRSVKGFKCDRVKFCPFCPLIVVLTKLSHHRVSTRLSDNVKSGPHQQQCRSNVRLCCQKRQQCRTSFALKLRHFDNVERCFDIVAQNSNIVEATGNFDNVASTLLLVWTGL